MSRTQQILWQTLQQAGVVQGDMPAKNKDASPWYIKVLLGIFYAGNTTFSFAVNAVEWVDSVTNHLSPTRDGRVSSRNYRLFRLAKASNVI